MSVSHHSFNLIFKGFCSVKQLLFALGNVQVSSCPCLLWQQTSQPSTPGAGFCIQLRIFKEIGGFWVTPAGASFKSHIPARQLEKGLVPNIHAAAFPWETVKCTLG